MRLIARYAKELIDSFEIVTVFENSIEREQISKEKPQIKSLSLKHPSAIWFERKMYDDFGIETADAFDKRPLVHQEYFPQNIHPMRKSFQEKSIQQASYKEYEYEAIKGDGVFQVSVGPIHAGIIEPGHFHFSQAGEKMLHQEVRHFYKYRAIEKMLEGKTLQEARSIIERISGNESIAYQLCWRDIVLQATNSTLSEELQKEHAMLLELERIAHHLTDLGFIPNDTGFASALAYCSKLSEDTRRKLKQLTNSRFGFNSINFTSLQYDKIEFYEWLDNLMDDILYYENWITDIPSLWDRMDTTGILEQDLAIEYDTVGVVARASGLLNDTRQNNFYIQNGFKIATCTNGDVASRFKVRVAEVKNSIKMIKNFLDTNYSEVQIGEVEDGEYMSFSESSLGELFMAIDINKGVIDRFFVRDPSFINWQALHLMMQNDIIADFPLINKSCDLSYAGNDL